MKPLTLIAISLVLLFTMLWAGGLNSNSAVKSASPLASDALAASSEQVSPIEACFAPGTPDSYMQEVQQRIFNIHALDYQVQNRWTNTATDGNTGTQGDPITITYSFIPDGVWIPSGAGEPNSPSNLYASFNASFGSEQAWKAKFAQIFAEWSAVCGVTYVEVPDDGAGFGPGSPGILGARGDVRIGAHPIDGGSGVLAWDQLPNVSDMCLDSDENWAVSGQDYIFLRNIVAHEHGHGLGMGHVCPINSTKLLEPYYSNAFNGPQHDDIRAMQRNYGDPFEPNDDSGEPTRLGVLAENFTLNTVSIDDNTDLDYYKFSTQPGKGFSLSLIPVGFEYLDGPQNGDGSCSAGTLTNSLILQNLDLTLYNSIGTIQLAQSNSHGVGETEQIYRYMAPAAGDSFIIQVTGGNANAIQLYKLHFDIFNLTDPYLTVFPVDFDTTRLGISVTRQTTLRNNAPTQLTISSITTTGPFTVVPNTMQTVPANSDLVLNVTYLADALGTQTGVLSIIHSGPGGNTTCDLIGTSVDAGLTFVNGTHANFGDVLLNHTDSVSVVLRVIGNIPLTISSMIAAAPFSIAFTPLTLNPAQTLIVRPYFVPTTLGPVEGTLIINHTGSSSPDTIYLSGVGTPDMNVVDHGLQPDVFRLEQNYPNPFNPTTQISFQLAKAGAVSLQVFDIQGRLVRNLIQENMNIGRYSVEFDGSDLSSGVYLYRLNAPGFSEMHKMILLK